MKPIKLICAAVFMFNAASAQELRSFTATYSQVVSELMPTSSTVLPTHKIQLSWNIPSEKNVLRFDIERSPDNEHFKKLRSIAQPFSLSESDQFNYTDIIANPGADIYYYRLRILSKGNQVKVTPAHVVRIKRTTTTGGALADAKAERQLKVL